jgi:uncharacterized membrane protein YtjA (UPF0391 family)
VRRKIFISYRRDDSAGQAGRIHDRLTNEFGEGVLFMDVDSIPLGADFTKVIKDEVSSCGILLAVIGHNWASARGSGNKRVFDDPNDFVRIEISTALERGIPVVPIFIDNASFPQTNMLPADLQPLTFRNGMRVRHESFKVDLQKLVTFLNQRFAAEPARGSRNFTSSVASSIALPTKNQHSIAREPKADQVVNLSAQTDKSQRKVFRDELGQRMNSTIWQREISPTLYPALFLLFLFISSGMLGFAGPASALAGLSRITFFLSLVLLIIFLIAYKGDGR